MGIAIVAEVSSDIAVIPTVETLPELFSEILFPTTLTNQQMSPTNLYETGYDLDGALTEWGDYVLGFDSPSVTPDSSSSMVESATSADEEETICYGMVSGHCIYLSDSGRDSPALAVQR